MLIGILSDTHDRADAMASAVKLLRERGTDYFIHCGDVGSEHVLDYFAGLPAAFVWGNTDYDRLGLQHYADKLSIACYGAFAEIPLEGKEFAVLHGDDWRARERILAQQRHDYLLQGHTHIRQDLKIGRVRCINPGALHRARPKTVALLDPQSDHLEFLTVDVP